MRKNTRGDENLPGVDYGALGYRGIRWRRVVNTLDAVAPGWRTAYSPTILGDAAQNAIQDAFAALEESKKQPGRDAPIPAPSTGPTYSTFGNRRAGGDRRSYTDRRGGV